jgi:serine/threonine-protein kinase
MDTLGLKNYRVIKKIGQGGMGVVYLAEDLNLGRMVALKFLAPYLVRDPEILKRFRAEARSQARLAHPHITMVYAFEEMRDQAFLVMEYVAGEALEDVIKERGRIPTEEAADIMGKVLAAMHYAHGKGVVHRDIKPANIGFTEEGVVKLMDFGIALNLEESKRLTRTGHILGTPHYMAPEQILGKPLDARTDIYALGITLYEMLAGRVPFEGDSDYTVSVAQINDPPPSLLSLGHDDITPVLEKVVFKALAKDPQKRYRNAEEFRQALIAAVKEKKLPAQESRPAPGRATQRVAPPVETAPPPPEAPAVQPPAPAEPLERVEVVAAPPEPEFIPAPEPPEPREEVPEMASEPEAPAVLPPAPAAPLERVEVAAAAPEPEIIPAPASPTPPEGVSVMTAPPSTPEAAPPALAVPLERVEAATPPPARRLGKWVGGLGITGGVLVLGLFLLLPRLTPGPDRPGVPPKVTPAKPATPAEIKRAPVATAPIQVAKAAPQEEPEDRPKALPAAPSQPEKGKVEEPAMVTAKVVAPPLTPPPAPVPPQKKEKEPADWVPVLQAKLKEEGFPDIRLSLDEKKRLIAAGQVKDASQKQKVINVVQAIGFPGPMDFSQVTVPRKVSVKPVKRTAVRETERPPPPKASPLKPLGPKLD